MKYLVLVLLAVSSLPSFASTRACALTADEDWKSFGKSYDRTDLTDAFVSKLDTLTKQQLIIAANDMSDTRYSSAVEAVRALKEASEAEDLEISHFIADGKRFTAITYYPGGNQGGWYFEFGGRSIVGTNSDGDVECVK